MKCITFAQTEWRSTGCAPTPPCRLAAHGPARDNAVNSPVSDIDAAAALDRRTVWPTHRIRCFLQAQRCQRASGTG
jgi:hypothetical protein